MLRCARAGMKIYDNRYNLSEKLSEFIVNRKVSNWHTLVQLSVWPPQCP
jgi:hypothetical protein